MKKCLLVTSEVPDVMVGGLGEFIRILYSQLKVVGYPVKLVYLNINNTTASRFADYNVRVGERLPVDSLDGSKFLSVAWGLRHEMDNILKEEQPDVISTHDAVSMLPFYYEREKVQFTLHSSHIGFQHERLRDKNGLLNFEGQKVALQSASSVVFHSQWAAQTASKEVTEHISGRKFIFPVGINSAEYPTEKAERDKIVISFFGRHFDFSKNFPALYSAGMSLSEDEKKRVKFRLYGAPYDIVEPQIRSEGLFRLMGFVSGEEKRQAFAETDIVVMPSLFENFGLVGLEGSSLVVVAEGMILVYLIARGHRHGRKVLFSICPLRGR